MKDLTILTNTQLGEFISLSLVHGTNTQFSYELLHEVAERLIFTDEVIKSGINYALKNQDSAINEPTSITLEDVAETLDEILAPAISEDNKETVEILTDIESYEAMDKAVKEAFEEEVEEEAPPVKKAPKKKETPAPVIEETLPSDDELIITGKMLKEKAMAMRQLNTIPADDIKNKLSELGVTSILALPSTYHLDFYNFLESYNV
jgi:hypothetical protein